MQCSDPVLLSELFLELLYIYLKPKETMFSQAMDQGSEVTKADKANIEIGDHTVLEQITLYIHSVSLILLLGIDAFF